MTAAPYTAPRESWARTGKGKQGECGPANRLQPRHTKHPGTVVCRRPPPAPSAVSGLPVGCPGLPTLPGSSGRSRAKALISAGTLGALACPAKVTASPRATRSSCHGVSAPRLLFCVASPSPLPSSSPTLPLAHPFPFPLPLPLCLPNAHLFPIPNPSPSFHLLRSLPLSLLLPHLFLFPFSFPIPSPSLFPSPPDKPSPFSLLDP